MRIGRIPEIAYKRSVLKKISTRPESMQVGVDAAHISLEDVTVVTSSSCILKWFQGCEKYYLQKAFNNIYASGGIPEYIQLKINIPINFEEKKLGKIIKCFDDVAQKEKVMINQCDVYASSINEMLIHIIVIGKAEKTFSIHNIKESMDVVMAGSVAIGATSIIAGLYEEKLREKFHGTFVDDCLKIADFINIYEITKIAKKYDTVYMHSVSDGGVFAAAWELASAVDLGICVDINRIPVWQETIEIAELFDYNPYMVDGTGAVLIVANDGEPLVEILKDKGIYAEVIGNITSGRDRVAVNGDEKRFLEPPRGDEIYNYIRL